MDFEPIEEELEQLLGELIAKADDMTGTVDDVNYQTLEFQALKDMGLFAECDEYLDGTASVRLTYGAMRYFDRKKKWEQENRMQTAKSAGEKVIDKGVDVIATIATKMAGM